MLVDNGLGLDQMSISGQLAVTRKLRTLRTQHISFNLFIQSNFTGKTIYIHSLWNKFLLPHMEHSKLENAWKGY